VVAEAASLMVVDSDYWSMCLLPLTCRPQYTRYPIPILVHYLSVSRRLWEASLLSSYCNAVSRYITSGGSIASLGNQDLCTIWRQKH